MGAYVQAIDGARTLSADQPERASAQRSPAGTRRVPRPAGERGIGESGAPELGIHGTRSASSAPAVEHSARALESLSKGLSAPAGQLGLRWVTWGTLRDSPRFALTLALLRDTDPFVRWLRRASLPGCRGRDRALDKPLPRSRSQRPVGRVIWDSVRGPARNPSMDQHALGAASLATAASLAALEPSRA
jgi:hypothetical protein